MPFLTAIPWLTVAKWAAIAFAVWFAWHELDAVWCNGACSKQAKRADAAEAKIVEMRTRVSEITSTLSSKLMEAMDGTKRATIDYLRVFSGVEAAASSVHSGSGISLPRDFVGVSERAARAANGQGDPETGPGAAAAVSGVPETAAGAVYDERELAEFNVKAAKAYRSCVVLLDSCYVRENEYLDAFHKGATP
jgi:hypothetical protein